MRGKTHCFACPCFPVLPLTAGVGVLPPDLLVDGRPFRQLPRISFLDMRAARLAAKVRVAVPCCAVLYCVVLCCVTRCKPRAAASSRHSACCVTGSTRQSHTHGRAS